MPRRVSIGVCAVLFCLLALPAAIASPRAEGDETGGQGVRSPSPTTETFHIAPGGPGYTTQMRFEQDKQYRFEISGTIVADEGGGYTSTLSAYHCLSGTFCDPIENCFPICPPPKSPQNFSVFDESSLSPSIDNGTASQGPPPSDGSYQFVWSGHRPAPGHRLTFLPLPNGRYGGKEATFSGEGFTFTVTELPSQCAARRAVAVRDSPFDDGCREFKFLFRTNDGLPDEPDDKDLPPTLLALEATGYGRGPESLGFDPNIGEDTYGGIRLTTTHTLAFDEREIFLRITRRPEYSKNGDKRKVDFRGFVVSSSEARCKPLATGDHFEGRLVVKDKRSALRLRLLCISRKPLDWRSKNIDKASITVGPRAEGNRTARHLIARR